MANPGQPPSHHTPPTAASWAAVYACNYTLHCWPLRTRARHLPGRILEPAAGGRGAKVGSIFMLFHRLTLVSYIAFLIGFRCALSALMSTLLSCPLPESEQSRAGASSSPSSSLEIHLAHAHAKQNVLQKGNTHATCTSTSASVSTSFFLVPLKVGGGTWSARVGVRMLLEHAGNGNVKLRRFLGWLALSPV